MNFDNLIYLDNNATTPIDSRVLSSMLPFYTNYFGNSSSTHEFGKTINQYINLARQQVANLLNADVNEIVFTSGSTESINLALKGVALSYQHKGNHIITCQTEHKAVLETCKYLERIGFEVTFLPVNSDGLIDISHFKSTLRPDTILVSIMWVNNETGVIQPIEELSNIAYQNGSIFFSDATQAVGKIPIDVLATKIDLLSFSAHKFYGPKGIGGLYKRKGIMMDSLIHGGGQEYSLRSGTSNVPAIIGLGEACDIAIAEMEKNIIKIEKNRNFLESELLKIKGTKVIGNREKRLHNVTNISFTDIDANVLIGKLKNIAMSNGSACTSAIVEPSHVLKAMGLTYDEALGSIRFSLSKYNTKEEIILVLKQFEQKYLS